MTKEEKLSKLYKQAMQYNEDLPAELMQKLSIYGQILEIIGGLHSESVSAWKLAESTRRETIANAMAYGANTDKEPVGTSAKDREAVAEAIGAESRRKESEAEGEALRWKNAYNSTSEQINMMKKRYDQLANVAKGGV